jgi:hypothetical protein
VIVLYLRWYRAENVEDGVNTGHQDGLLSNPSSLLKNPSFVIVVS